MPFGHFGNEQYNLGPGSELTLIDSPDDIAGLTQWYKTDVGVTGTDPVTAWADQSGEGNNLTVSGNGSNCTLVDIGGIDFVRTFDGDNMIPNIAVLSAAADIDTRTQMHFFCVANRIHPIGNMFQWNHVAAGSGAFQIRPDGATDGVRAEPEGQAIVLTPGWIENETAIIECEIDMSLGTAFEMQIRVNDFETHNAAITATSFTTGGNTDFHLGSLFGPGSGNTDNSALAELIVYMGKVLTSDERDAVLAYLSGKYSITLGA